MATAKSGVRVFGENRAIDYAHTLAFFNARARMATQNRLTATMYQDTDLANRRDHAEKQTVLPLLNVQAADRVLDIGCGLGRWGEVIAPLACAYLGLDFSPGLLAVARARVPSAVFQCMPVNSLDAGRLQVPPPFNVFVCSGVLTYLNDADVVRLFAALTAMAHSPSRIYIREPVARNQRLTLDSYWSEELGAEYSAVYRTRAEYLDLFAGLPGFRICNEGQPFADELQNRVETEQRFFILHRAAR